MENNKGFMTIEASVIVPTILICAFFIILGLLFTYERANILSNEYRVLYSIPIKNIRDKTVEHYINGKDYTYAVIYGNADVNGEYVKHKASCTGSLDIYGKRNISTKREIDVCVDRLRRWQLYDDIREESGN